MQPVRRAYNLTTLMCRLSRNSGSLNLLGPYGPVQSCNGRALLLLLLLFSPVTVLFSSSTSCDPHHSCFQFQTAVLSALSVMLQVQLFYFVVNLLNIITTSFVATQSPHFRHYLMKWCDFREKS